MIGYSWASAFFKIAQIGIIIEGTFVWECRIQFQVSNICLIIIVDALLGTTLKITHR